MKPCYIFNTLLPAQYEEKLTTQPYIVLAGGFDDPIANTCWYVQYNIKPQPDLCYNINAEETDTRMWVHVKQTQCTRILVLSLDTDIYHIGLPLNRRSKQVVI